MMLNRKIYEENQNIYIEAISGVIDPKTGLASDI